jgi:hypothetical protein
MRITREYERTQVRYSRSSKGHCKAPEVGRLIALTGAGLRAWPTSPSAWRQKGYAPGLALAARRCGQADARVTRACFARSVIDFAMSGLGSGTAFQVTWPPGLLLRVKPPKTAGKRTSTTLTAGIRPATDVARNWLGRLGIAHKRPSHKE